MTKQKYTIRCSQLDRILNCAHSLRLPSHSTTSAYAQKGTDEHLKALYYFCGKDVGITDPNTKMYVDYVEGYKIEQKLKGAFDEFTLTGTCDAYHIKDNVLEIVDLKTGHVPIEPTSNQLKGYALLVLGFEIRPHTIDNVSVIKFLDEAILKCNVETVKLTIVQNCEIKTIECDAETILELENRIQDSLKYWSFNSGKHCTYCPSKRHCIKMRNPLDNGDQISLVENKSNIAKMLDETKDELIKSNPDLFVKVGRKYKVWIDETKCPVATDKIMTAAKAFELYGDDVAWNIKEELKYSWRLK